jgi:RNA polymerase sigma-70 factor (ECF subfamily)
MAESITDNDEALLARIRGGDQQAFAILVRRHTNMFFAAAYRMCGNTQKAEDVVQEAFLKLWSKPEAWDPSKGTKFTTWFYRVVTNMTIDVMRREKRFADPAVMEFIPDQAASALSQLEAGEEHEILEAAIARLPDRQKVALNLCVYEGLSNREAAEVLGIGVKALESLLMRAKAGLKDEFKREGLIEESKVIPYERRRSHV